MSSVYNKMTDSEKAVAEFLSEIDVWWKFESPIFVSDEMERPRVWTPDFNIPKLGLYVEVCGSEEFDYNYREEIYSKNEISVIFAHAYKEDSEWKKYLVRRFEEIHDYRTMIIEKMKSAYPE